MDTHDKRNPHSRSLVAKLPAGLKNTKDPRI